jgi:hypothetical protein
MKTEEPWKVSAIQKGLTRGHHLSPTVVLQKRKSSVKDSYAFAELISNFKLKQKI